jgi:acetyl esterase
MPVHPELVDIVKLAAAAAGPALDPSAVGELRELARAAAIAYGEGPDCAAVEDRTISGPRGDLAVRVYTPSASPRGVLVFFHGSGFVIYDLDTHDKECRLLANGAEVVVVGVDYALAPEHPFPAAFDDCVAATRWVAAHRADLGGDALPIAVGGDSAGGNLAAAVSSALRGDHAVALQGQMLVYPVTDLANRASSFHENGEGFLLTAPTLEFFYDCYISDPNERHDPRASPLLATDFDGLPPTLVVTAEVDPLRDEGEAYARALVAAGIDVTLTRYDDAVHGFFQMSAFSALARQAIDECSGFLRSVFT